MEVWHGTFSLSDQIISRSSFWKSQRPRGAEQPKSHPCSSTRSVLPIVFSSIQVHTYGAMRYVPKDSANSTFFCLYHSKNLSLPNYLSHCDRYRLTVGWESGFQLLGLVDPYPGIFESCLLALPIILGLSHYRFCFHQSQRRRCYYRPCRGIW